MITKRFRQYFGIAMAVAAYYLVHEGAHLLFALSQGVFKGIRWMGIGMQIETYAERMSEVQLGLFCLVGGVSTALAAWTMLALTRRITMMKSKVALAACYYITMALLFIAPVYLSVLCDLFGGGDMNGIRLIMPEIPVRIGFGALGVLHGWGFFRHVLPAYSAAFRRLEA